MQIQTKKSRDTLIAIGLMIISMANFSAMNIAIRALVDDMPTTQMVFLRNITAFGLILIWIAAMRMPRSIFRTAKPFAHFWRGAIGFMAMSIWFYSVSLMPVTLATALSFTTPIFATIFAIIFLKEKAGWRRWSAVSLGFIGVMVILRPGAGDVTEHAGLVLVSSALMALASIVVKSLTKTEAPETIVFYMVIVMSFFSFFPAMLHWGPITLHSMGLIFLIAFFSTASHLLLARAYQRADMVTLLPFDFTRLIFTASLGYLFFGEVLDGPTWIGAGIIMASSVYIVHRENVRRRKILVELPEEEGF